MAMGLYYLITYGMGQREATTCCKGDEPNIAKEKEEVKSTSMSTSTSTEPARVSRAAAVSLVMLTTFSPCVGSMPVLAILLAPPVTTITIIATWLTIFIAAAAVMLPLVFASFVGVRAASVARVRKHERLAMGIALIALAIVTLFFSSDHENHTHVHGAPSTHLDSTISEGHVTHGDIHVAGKRGILGADIASRSNHHHEHSTYVSVQDEPQ